MIPSVLLRASQNSHAEKNKDSTHFSMFFKLKDYNGVRFVREAWKYVNNIFQSTGE